MKRNFKSNKRLENNFKQNKSHTSFNSETGVINNPNHTAVYSDDTFGINYMALALNFNIYKPLGEHEGNEFFIKSVLTPAFIQAAQLVSNYNVRITEDKIKAYFNRIAAMMSFIITCRQVISYVNETGTINPAVYELYNKRFTSDVLQKIDILEQSVLQHYLPPRFVKDLVDHYTWRQSGKTAFSGIIGNTSLDFADIDAAIDYQLNDINAIALENDSIYPIIAKISMKADIDWSINSLPEIPGTLSYDEEFTGRFINTPILQDCGGTKLMCTHIGTTTFGSLVSEPSAIEVLTCPYYKTVSTRPYIGFIDPRLDSGDVGFGIIVSNPNNNVPSILQKSTTSYFNEILSALGRHTTVISDMKQPVHSRMSVPGSMIIQNVNKTSLEVLYTKYMNYLFEVPSITKIV